MLLAPPEEMIWSKAFVLERERYDGARREPPPPRLRRALDWERLLARFDRHWEVLLSHLLLYRFAYPGERSQVPDWVMRELLRARRRTSSARRPPERRSAAGNLISRVQYRHDLEHLGYEDGRALGRARSAAEGDAWRMADGILPAGGGR